MLAKYAYLVNQDIESCIGYICLTAKSYSLSYDLYDKGMKTGAWIERDISSRKSGEFATYCAIVVDNYDLAKSISSENTAIGNLLLGNIEKAKQCIEVMSGNDELKEAFLI